MPLPLVFLFLFFVLFQGKGGNCLNPVSNIQDCCICDVCNKNLPMKFHVPMDRDRLRLHEIMNQMNKYNQYQSVNNFSKSPAQPIEID